MTAVPAMQEAEMGGPLLKANLWKNLRSYLKNKKD
jgi:hypothetical protein